MKKLLASFLALSILLMGCGGVKDEKQAWTDATVEATCLVFQADNIFDPGLEDQAKDIYKKYGFDADDDTVMNELTLKYQNDPDVQAAVQEALEECAPGLMDAFEDVPVDEPIVEDVVVEEETVMEEEEPAVEEEEPAAEEEEPAAEEEPV